MDDEARRHKESRYGELTEKITKLIERRELLRLELRKEWGEVEGYLPVAEGLIEAISKAAGVDPMQVQEAADKELAPLLTKVDTSWFWTNNRIVASIVKGVIEVKEAAVMEAKKEPDASVQGG